MLKNTKKHQKWPKTPKNTKKHQKSRKTQKCQNRPPSRDPPGPPKKKASLSNRRIGTRNHVFYMVSIQKCHFSTPPDRACARPPKKGRIKAKLKFFFELFQKSLKNRIFWPILAFFHNFCLFWPFLPFLRFIAHLAQKVVYIQDILNKQNNNKP